MPQCSKCSETLIVKSRTLCGLEEKEHSMFDRYKLKYQLILTCPSRLRMFGFFKEHHDQTESYEYE